MDLEGKSIAGARISAEGHQQPNDLEVTTDEAGRFAIDGMVDGWVDVASAEITEIPPTEAPNRS